MSKHLFSLAAIACLSANLLLAGCSPKYDWRQVQGTGAPYTVLLPAKPATLSRPINLDGLQVNMTMTAAEVDGVTFAVGTAELPDAAQVPAALAAMKTALVRNIEGKIRVEKPAAGAEQAPGATEIEAVGTPGKHTGGEPRVLHARFTAHGRQVYQVVMVGPEKSVTPEALETFFTSFKTR